MKRAAPRLSRETERDGARLSNIIPALTQHREMDAKTIDEDFRRATKDARSNWTQVERSLDNLMKSTQSNKKIRAQIRRLQYLTKKVSNIDDVEFHWDSLMGLKKNAGNCLPKMKKLTVVLTDINKTETCANHADTSEENENRIETSGKRKRSADTSVRCDYCSHPAKKFDELLDHLKSYRQCFDHYRLKARTMCFLCDKSFIKVRKHVYDVIKRRVKFDPEKHDLHEKFFALFYNDDKKKITAKKRAPPKPKSTRRASNPILLDPGLLKSEPNDESYIVELQSDDEDITYFGDFLEEDKENDDQAALDETPKPAPSSQPDPPAQPDTTSKPGPAFHLSSPSKSGSLIPSSLPAPESELASQEDISTDSCDQDYYLPDDNTPVLEIIQSMSDNTATKVDDPNEITIKVENGATEKIYGPKVVSEKAKNIPPAAQLPIKGTTDCPKGKRSIQKVKTSLSILSRDRPQQLIGVQNPHPGQLIAIPISSSTSEPFPQQIQLNGQSLNVIQLPNLVNGMTVTTTPIPPVSSASRTATTIIPLSEMNDSYKLVNIPQNQQQITKFPVWEIPQKPKNSVVELRRVNR